MSVGDYYLNLLEAFSWVGFFLGVFITLLMHGIITGEKGTKLVGGFLFFIAAIAPLFAWIFKL